MIFVYLAHMKALTSYKHTKIQIYKNILYCKACTGTEIQNYKRITIYYKTCKVQHKVCNQI